MKLKPTAECISCILRQVLEACEETDEDPTVRYNALREAIAYLNNVDFDRSDHVRIASDLHRIVREVTGNADPYRELKKMSNRVALEWLSRNGRTLQGSLPFKQAISIAARGNMIDYGAMETTETPQALIDKAMDARIDSRKVLEVRRLVEVSERVLYLCDNAGEIAFDKVMVSAIQTLGPEVTVAVRGGPVMNDATIDDAYEVEMTKLAKTITTGSPVSGVLLTDSSPEFLDTFDQSDLIISKGQGNLESLINIRRKTTTVYILKVKCNLIADFLKSQIGATEIVIQRKRQAKR
jgi:damage-control phosphatase, subfamily I